MQTSKIKQWAALLLTFSGMAASTLTVSAASKTINPGNNVVESGSSYGATTYAALLVNAGTYTGTNITLTTAATDHAGASVVAKGSLTLRGSAITVSSTAGDAVFLTGTSAGHLENVSITTNENTTWGVAIQGSSTLTGKQLQVVMHGDNSRGVQAGLVAGDSGFAELEDVTVQADGAANVGLSIGGLGSRLVVQNAQINMQGDRSWGLLVQGGTVSGRSAMYATNVTVLVTGTAAHGVSMSSYGESYLEMTGCEVTVTGQKSNGITLGQSEGSDHILIVNSSTVIAEQGAGLMIGGSITPVGSHSGGIYGANNQIYIGDQTLIKGAEGAIVANTAVNDGADNAPTTTTIQVTGSSMLDGKVTANHNSELSISLDGGSSLTGDATANDNSILTISGSNGSSITGNVNANDDANVNVNLDDSNLTGNITGSGSSSIIITGSNGSTVTGTATVNDNATIDITVSGPGSSFIGDSNQNNDGKIIINIDGGASGTGGFNGGDLIVTGSDSSWYFDKDSHVNNGYNDGTLNINNKDVTFDNLTNNGKIIIDVNSDDQSHGKLDVTGTANGGGSINVNVTGSTAVSDDDRDKILNDMFDHNAKDAWNIDDIDWGLIVVSPTTAPDGSIYSRPNGKLSEAGNIATGLIAAQKSSWFAQQNSLLKRMGELRLQNRVESVTISGKEDKEVAAPMLSADKLIENVWIRSYGQQLNYGSSVTGQAFKQYVYGVDLGTDHKWQLDADNQLFVGVFLGYGAADTDHRHHGSKSEISNYYAGLYASWLNVDGWYLDATLKAQYTDNELNGNTGANYFNGSYNNWSVGGSVEFGKQIKFKDDWFVEPQLQANYLHILASDYTMSQGLNVNVSDLDAFQLRFGIVAGKTLKLKNGGALQPYFKISGVEMVSTGGKLSAMGNSVRPNLDGARAELGAGIIWQLDEHNQLHLDYEASFGDKYDKPWGLTAGYRYQF